MTSGAAHPHSVLSLENLGRLLQRQGKGTEAESLFQQALELRKTTETVKSPGQAEPLVLFFWHTRIYEVMSGWRIIFTKSL